MLLNKNRTECGCDKREDPNDIVQGSDTKGKKKKKKKIEDWDERFSLQASEHDVYGLSWSLEDYFQKIIYDLNYLKVYFNDNIFFTLGNQNKYSFVKYKIKSISPVWGFTWSFYATK